MNNSIYAMFRFTAKDYIVTKYGGEYFWLGLTDTGGNNQWRWEHADGSTECLGNFENWAIGEPNQDSETCSITEKSKGWADVVCDRAFEFLCQIIDPQQRMGMITWE